METHRIREPLAESERAMFEGYAAAIFTRMGMNVDTAGTHETPRRWLTALWDMTEGYDGDSKLSTLFPVECPVCPDEEKTHIVEGPIRFTGLCEHHVLPIRGSAWVGYLADEKLVGISKLTRIVRLYSKRFTSQERICHEVANELTQDVHPRGIIVYTEAEHFCMQARGVRELSSRTGALVTRGAYNTNPHLAEEFRLLIGRHPSVSSGA
ncbi:MAG TPA: GTP cyclohydrolase I [Bryobacteraceae bacterium]|nr:GTP cyclohydrolase I [Bryobacteraceae bacterium]